jgi:hypothetical protein
MMTLDAEGGTVMVTIVTMVTMKKIRRRRRRKCMGKYIHYQSFWNVLQELPCLLLGVDPNVRDEDGGKQHGS